MIYDYLDYGFLGRRGEYEKEEGLDLQAQGEVYDVVKDNHKVTGIVRGKRVTIYYNDTEDGEEFSYARCSCGEYECSHVAALLYELKEESYDKTRVSQLLCYKN